MEKYIGVKMIEARPMTLGDYNTYRTWNIPDDEDPTREGYLVKYSDGYESWSPKEIFEESYRPTIHMNFGLALEALKRGKAVYREQWAFCQNVFVVYQKGYPDGIPCNKQTAEAWDMKEGDNFICNPYLQMQLPDGSHSMWMPSTEDLLSDDWIIRE